MPREIYVNISIETPRNAPSFEERRMQDYLHAYRSTGKPPAPCPQQPTDRAQRAVLGLPPFIEPYSELVHINTDVLMGRHDEPALTPVVSGTARGPIRDVQIFRPEPVSNEVRGAVFQCIVCQPEFLAWSVEELRASAYAMGHKYAPEPTPRPALGTMQPTMNGTAPENFQSLTCKPDYMKHNFEELRVAFYRAGRQLKSTEIVERNATLRMTAL